MRRNLLRAILLASALVTAPACAGAPAPTAATVERDVPVDGAGLHFTVRPGHGPIVLFEAGGGETSTAWTKVLEQLGPRTGATLVAYDRAGTGKSQPLTSLYDVHEEIIRLHKALYTQGLDGPVILVGHSYAGFLIQLYANIYPQDVAALVYVDANTVESISEESMKRVKAVMDQDDKTRPDYDARMLDAFPATRETLKRYPVPCGLPVTVITQGKRDLEPLVPEWRKGHEALAARTGGRFIIAEGSGHGVQNEAPQLVVDAILAQLKALPAKPGKRTFLDAATTCPR